MESYANYYSSSGGGGGAGPVTSGSNQQQQYHHATQRTLHAPIHNSIADGRATNNVEFVVQQHNFDPGPPAATEYPHEYVTYAAGNHYYDYNGYDNGSAVMNITGNPAYDQPELLNGTPYSAYRNEYRSSSGYEQAAVVRQLQEKFNGVITSAVVATNGQVIVGSGGSNNGKPVVVYDEDSFELGGGDHAHPNVRPGTISEQEKGTCGLCLDAIFCSGGSRQEQNGFEDTVTVAENGPDVSAVGVVAGSNQAGNKLRTPGGGGVDEEEMLRNSDYVKSVWIHCRLPLLILLFSALLILFLLFSGALIYLKCELLY